MFLASAFVAVLTIGLGTQFVTSRISAQAEAQLQRDLEEAASLVEEHHANRLETLAVLGSLIADLPKLKAAVATGDSPTIEPVARDYQLRVQCEFLVITDEDGNELVGLGGNSQLVRPRALNQALRGLVASSFQPTGRGALEITTFPILVGPEPQEILGTLSLGFEINAELVSEYRDLTQSEVVFMMEDRILASSFDVEHGTLTEAFAESPPVVRVHGEDFLMVRQAYSSDGDGAEVQTVVLQSRSERLALLSTFRQGLIISAIFGVLLAILLSYAVARTVTRPLAAITSTMRDMAATGDFTRQIDLPRGSTDEDATLLAGTFNHLVDSVARFQKESVLKERLSSLGRISTILAHEIRNPLMIIKASLRSLRKETPDKAAIREAAEDIDHEVGRLNRLVSNVLDFARPVHVELGEVNIHELIERLAHQISRQHPSVRLELKLEKPGPLLESDGELLESALSNVLTNAFEAVRADRETASLGTEGEDIELETKRVNAHLRITIRDRGPGVSEEDLPRVFEPYFTSKRTGTGLGLAITRNIVDSLGGTIELQSTLAEGTNVVIELPATKPQAGRIGP